MPEVTRIPVRMDCKGIDLYNPVDRMPPGYFPYLENARVVEEGRLESRPGYSDFFYPQGFNWHSIRRLNDVDQSFAAAGYIYVAGNGQTLYAGIESMMAPIDIGYSGNPLSLLTFRPENAPEHWMYVYDFNKSSKVRPDGALRQIGVVPPPAPIEATYGPPASVTIDAGQDNTVWSAVGPISTVDLVNREGASTTSTIVTILYDKGSTGWCCINAKSTVGGVDGPPAWAGERMELILNSGGGNQETVLLREIHPAITATTIQGIQYDSGTSGPCTMVLANSPIGLARNSMLFLNSGGGNAENVRVLSVTQSPAGAKCSDYSIRCVTANTHAAAEAATGLISWYVYAALTHVATETITSQCVYARGTAVSHVNTTAAIQRLVSLDASKANNRPVLLGDDYLHISFWATVAPNIVQLQLWIDIDAGTTTLTPGTGGAFQNNYILFTLSPADIFGAGIPTEGSWNEITIPLSEGVRIGNDPTRTLANIKALQIEVTLNGQTDFAFDWWYLFGTFGPTILLNSPTGFLYASRNRDSTTGAASVPSPQTRHELFPLREEVLLTPSTSSQVGIDSLDVYRQGGTLTNFTYVGTVVNNPTGTPSVYADKLPDDSLAGSPEADFSLLQPWPEQDLPWSGVAYVVGTKLIWQSGSILNPSLLSGQVILIAGIAYQTRGQPKLTTIENSVELTASAGVQTGVNFQVEGPILAGQPLPFVFGPLEGPFAPVAFGLGDSKNAGTLYYSNTGNLDAASDANTLEICPPGEPLISGGVWNGIVFVGSRENIYVVRYTFQQSPLFQFQRIPSPSGIWSRWASCSGPDGFYFLGRDGFYRANESGVERVLSPDGFDPLYPLFPHDGQQATGSPDLSPIPMDRLSGLRLSYADNCLYFDSAGSNPYPVSPSETPVPIPSGPNPPAAPSGTGPTPLPPPPPPPPPPPATTAVSVAASTYPVALPLTQGRLGPFPHSTDLWIICAEIDSSGGGFKLGAFKSTDGGVTYAHAVTGPDLQFSSAPSGGFACPFWDGSSATVEIGYRDPSGNIKAIVFDMAAGTFGSVLSTGQTVDAAQKGSLILVKQPNTHLSILYSSEGSAALATTYNGSSWSAPVTLNDNSAVNWFVDNAIVDGNGNIGVLICQGSGFAFRFGFEQYIVYSGSAVVARYATPLQNNFMLGPASDPLTSGFIFNGVYDHVADTAGFPIERWTQNLVDPAIAEINVLVISTASGTPSFSLVRVQLFNRNTFNAWYVQLNGQSGNFKLVWSRRVPVDPSNVSILQDIVETASSLGLGGPWSQDGVYYNATVAPPGGKPLAYPEVIIPVFPGFIPSTGKIPILVGITGFVPDFYFSNLYALSF